MINLALFTLTIAVVLESSIWFIRRREENKDRSWPLFWARLLSVICFAFSSYTFGVWAFLTFYVGY